MKKFAAIRIDGKLTIHMDTMDDNYATLCCLDGEGLIPVKVLLQKINCPHCRAIWNMSKSYKESDFVV